MKLSRRKFCECGCGQRIRGRNCYGQEKRFIHGHNQRGKDHSRTGMYGKQCSDATKIKISISNGGIGRIKVVTSPAYCKCGCSQLTSRGREYKHGHNQRGKSSSGQTRSILSFQKMGDKNPSKRVDVRDKISKALMGKFAGEKHPNWLGGISFEPYSLVFNTQLKNNIRERDGYRCQICLRPQNEFITKLHVHHIDYNKKNCEEDNLISLCPSCHVRTNKDRKEWQSVFASQ